MSSREKTSTPTQSGRQIKEQLFVSINSLRNPACRALENSSGLTGSDFIPSLLINDSASGVRAHGLSRCSLRFLTSGMRLTATSSGSSIPASSKPERKLVAGIDGTMTTSSLRARYAGSRARSRSISRVALLAPSPPVTRLSSPPGLNQNTLGVLPLDCPQIRNSLINSSSNPAFRRPSSLKTKAPLAREGERGNCKPETNRCQSEPSCFHFRNHFSP